MDTNKPSHLPAIVPPAALVLRRTQTTLGLLREVAQETTAKYWFERGKEAEGSTQWAEAAYAYRQCVERDPSHWRGAMRLAAMLAHLDQAEAAAVTLSEAMEIAAVEGHHPLVAELSEPTWHFLRDCLEAARSTAQNGFGLLLGLALVYRALKQKEHARRTLDVMQFMYQQQVARSAQLLRLSGNLYSDAKCYDEAVQEYDRAIELKPNLAVLYFNRGSIKHELKDYDGTISDYNRAIELKPAYANAYNNRGNAKVEIGDYAGAINDYDCAIELNLEFPMVYRNRGNAKEKLEDYVGAISDFTRFIELKPNHAFTYRRRGYLKINLKDYTGAINDCERAIELKPDYAFAYLIRGVAKHELKEYAEAIADYDRSIELEPENANYYSFRSRIKDELGDTAGAIADRQKADQIEADRATK